MSKNNIELIAKRRISPATWKALVAQVPRAYRCEVAHIVWWDWFGSRIAADRWTHLDPYLKRPVWNKPTDEQLIHGLVLCGYSEKHAISRIGNKGNKGQSKA